MGDAYIIQRIEFLCSHKSTQNTLVFLEDSNIPENVKIAFVTIARMYLKLDVDFAKIVIHTVLTLQKNELKNEYFINDKFMNSSINLSKENVILLIKKIIQYKKLDSNSSSFSLVHYRKFLNKLETDNTNIPSKIEDYQIYFSNAETSDIYKKYGFVSFQGV